MTAAPMSLDSQDELPLLLHVWSGPRSLSTAFMYSFSRHSRCTHCADEPLYAAYLQRNPHLYRPYRAELLQQAAAGLGGQHLPARAAMQRLLDVASAAGRGSFVYAKHIAKMYDDRDIPDELLLGTHAVRVRHVVLVRDPLDMVRSWTSRGVDGAHSLSAEDSCCLEATNLPQLAAVLSRLKRLAAAGSGGGCGCGGEALHRAGDVVVVDVDRLKQDPRGVLAALCGRLQLPFDEQMLHWPAGPKPQIDGMWASHWYGAVHASTGFGAAAPDRVLVQRQEAISSQVLQVYREALPFYLLLARQALGVHPLSSALSSASPAAVDDACAVDAVASAAAVGGGGGAEQSIIDHGLSLPSAAASTVSASAAGGRNADVLVWIGDRLLPREYAAVSVFDSTVQGGDAVWEGLRIYDGRVLKLEEHLQRMMDSAVAMCFERVPSKEFIRGALFETLRANGMRDGVHVRMTLSRGLKTTSSMNPKFNSFGCWLLIVPEFKPVGNAATYDNVAGVDLITAANRRSAPATIDNKIHHNNLIQNILAKVQANNAGAADALMLDTEGFVSETNATNVFLVKNGQVHTPTADYCLPGITRRTVMELIDQMPELPAVVQRKISLSEFHAADEVFTTGTMGELTPVRSIDGRRIGSSCSYQRPVTQAVQRAYRLLTEKEGVPIPL